MKKLYIFISVFLMFNLSFVATFVKRDSIYLDPSSPFKYRLILTKQTHDLESESESILDKLLNQTKHFEAYKDRTYCFFGNGKPALKFDKDEDK